MDRRRGVVMINTGHGKGKTTAALGAVLRAAGQGLSCLVLQFIKSDGGYGEIKSLSRLPGVETRSLGLGLMGKGDLTPHREAARDAWRQAQDAVRSGAWDLIVLDELCIAMRHGFVSLEEVVELIKAKPAELILIITGRDCPPELFAHADAVTEMKMIKHHLNAGISSQAGVEY
ncbi:hypothetical protein AAU61_00410 [Desulfocarbo indianensis]|nr:hypothetical protein AAU61_00410 [Desulfocarbo indianensis]